MNTVLNVMSGLITITINTTALRMKKPKKIRNWFRLEKEGTDYLLQTSLTEGSWITIRTFSDSRKARSVFRKIWWMNDYPLGAKKHTCFIAGKNWRLITQDEAREYMTSLNNQRDIYSIKFKENKTTLLTDAARLSRSKIFGYVISEEALRNFPT